MKARYIIMMSLATLAISCSQKEEDKLFNERPAYDVFYAKMENADTKVFADDLLRVLWDADDRVSIFNKYTFNQEYRFNGETGDNAGAFKIVESEDFVAGNALDKVYSVYPYIESTKIDNNGLITIVMPAEQKYREDSFGIGANTMIAISENNQLMFKNLCGYMIVKLYGDDVTVKSLTIKGNKGESISGKANVTAEIDKVPEIIFAETATKSITLTCDTPVMIGSTPETATPFWIVVPPVVFSEGFTLTVTAADGGVYSKSTSNKFEITRNGISRMVALETLPIQPGVVARITLNKTELTLPVGKPESLVATIYPESASGNPITWTSSANGIATVDENGKVTAMNMGTAIITAKAGEKTATCNVTVTAPDENSPINFADPTAKYACVEKFDTNHDGEVSYAEAAAATSLSGLFTNWNTVTSFDEIQYFTGVTSTIGVFTGLTKLKHITIPDWITTLGPFLNCSGLETVVLPAALPSLPAFCFDECSALKKVTLPTSLTSIPESCFRGCFVLETLVMPSTVTSIGNYSFSGCSLLVGLDLSSCLQTIGASAFKDCQSITSIDFPATLTSIGQYAFSGCTALTSVTLGSAVSLGQYAFSGCSHLVSVVLPETLTSVPNNCFQYCNALTTIVWPQALTTIGNNAFAGCRLKDADFTLELPSTVTSIGSSAFGYIRHLLFPSTTPVNVASNSFVTNYTFLYVPDNMVEMYKVRTNWSDYADYIKPISDYPFVPQGEAVGGTVGEAIDLGLSVKWASWNVGASSPEEYGAYLAWGVTDLNWGNYYSWETYKWCNGTNSALTKYCPSEQTGYWDGVGSPDNKVTLDLEDDAAHVNWGGSWRIPMDEEWTELRNNCTCTWIDNYNNTGIAGMIVTSKKSGYTNKSIFLPAAGYRYNSDLHYVGSYGHYRSSSLRTDRPYYAWYVYFVSSDVYGYYGNRCYGLSVRPVSE